MHQVNTGRVIISRIGKKRILYLLSCGIVTVQNSVPFRATIQSTAGHHVIVVVCFAEIDNPADNLEDSLDFKLNKVTRTILKLCSAPHRAGRHLRSEDQFHR